MEGGLDSDEQGQDTGEVDIGGEEDESLIDDLISRWTTVRADKEE
jgi:hypothetical protein